MWLKIDDNEKRPDRPINLDKAVSIETRWHEDNLSGSIWYTVFVRYDAAAGYEFSSDAGDVALETFTDDAEAEIFVDFLCGHIRDGCKEYSLTRLLHESRLYYEWWKEIHRQK